MDKNVKNIMREKIINYNLQKKDIYWNIKKSIQQNNNINNNIKVYINYDINIRNTKNNFLTKKHKICLYTGKRGGILKGFNFSRYVLKNLILMNKLTNIKKNNW
jgi:ribosomal protein S14